MSENESRSVPLSDFLGALRQNMEQDRGPAPEHDGQTCHWCQKACGGTCLGLPETMTQMSPTDPAYWMLADGKTTSTNAYDEKCYICRDPEFAQMGLPLCKTCPDCTKAAGKPAGHVAADDVACTVCGADTEYAEYMASQGAERGEAG